MIKIKEICQEIGFIPSKRKGQNFLINEKILDEIVEVADINKDDVVLEIGPGLGNLTEKLAERAKKVVAVEIDKKLSVYLKEKFSRPDGIPSKAGKNQSNINIIQGDILDDKIISYFRKSFVVRSGYKIVANLPYNITGAILRKFLSEQPKPSSLVLMIQKEVGDRILAKNNKNSMPSLMVEYYSRPEIIRYVSKGNFWPQPKVDSVVLKFIIRGKTAINDEKKEKIFFQLLRCGFSSPRKQLINNLKNLGDKNEIFKILLELKLSPAIRSEELILNDWLRIYYHVIDSLKTSK